jgi:16S rRNA (adenine1518-N6/adenine1519-N6)-dimethyltransferase
MVYAKKSLGQHFLTSEKALKQIVAAGSLSAKDTVLEIGPGRGALTAPLLATGARVLAIEKDADMVTILTERFSDEISSGRLVLITGDVRALDSDTLDALCAGGQYKVIANIPYYITGEIIRQFLTVEPQPISMTLLVQREVAERIARDMKESILSLSVKVYGTPQYIDTVPAGAFSPPPSVDSAILHISSIQKKAFQELDELDFFTAVKTGFAARRKQLKGNLRTLYTQTSINSALQSCGLTDTIRGEDVSCEQWIRIAQTLKRK